MKKLCGIYQVINNKMKKEKLTQLESLLVEFRNSDNIGLGEMEQLEYIDGLISWVHELVIEE